MDGFVKFHRSADTLELIKKPKAFALLALIALRAKRTNCLSIHSLEPGEALIGDHKECGLTQREYRTAKSWLKTCQFATFKATNKGTIAKLTGTSVFDINIEQPDKQTDKLCDKQATSKRQLTRSKRKKEEKHTAEKDFFSFLNKYSADQQNIIQNHLFPALASIRKLNRISDSILLAELNYYSDFPPAQVESAIRKYLDGQYYKDGKDEKYLRGILRNEKREIAPAEKSTGSPVLDKLHGINPY